MNDKTIIELVVSQKIMICQYFAVQLFVSVFRKANCLSLLLTIVNFSSLSI